MCAYRSLNASSAILGALAGGENLYGVHSAPVRLSDQTKLVYSPHTCERYAHLPASLTR